MLLLPPIIMVNKHDNSGDLTLQIIPITSKYITKIMRSRVDSATHYYDLRTNYFIQILTISPT